MDYGKMAYLQIKDMEKRISAVSSAVSRQKSRTVMQRQDNITLDAVSNKITFAVSVSKSEEVEINLTAVYNSTAVQSADVSMTVDDCEATAHTENMPTGCGVINLCACVTLNGTHEIAVVFDITNGVSVSVCLTCRGKNLIGTAQDALLVYTLAGNGYYYGIIIGQTLSLYQSGLQTVTQIDLPSLDTAQLLWYGNALYLLYTVRGKLTIAPIANGELGTGTVLMNSVTAYCICGNIIFTCVRNAIASSLLTSPTTVITSQLFVSDMKCSSLSCGQDGNDVYLAVGGSKCIVYLSQNNGDFTQFLTEDYLNQCGISVSNGIEIVYYADGRAIRTAEVNGERAATALCYCDCCICAQTQTLVYKDGRLQLI